MSLIRSLFGVPSRPIFNHYYNFIHLHNTAQRILASPKLLGEQENLACRLCSLSHCILHFLAWRPSAQSYQPTTHIICYWICWWVGCQGCLLSKSEQTHRAHHCTVHLSAILISSRALPRWATSISYFHRGITWLMDSRPGGHWVIS